MATDMNFAEFWAIYPHPKAPRSRGSKPKTKLMYEGKKRTEGGGFITPDMHATILEAVEIHKEAMLSTDEQFWPMAQTWIYQERWETVMEAHEEVIKELEEQEAAAERANAEQKRRLEFNRGFHAWRKAHPRMPGEPKHTVEEYKAYLESKPRLRVVGIDD